MSAVPLEPGAEVAVLSLGRKRGVVLSRARDGRYRVRVGQLTLWCGERDVEALEQAPTRRAARRREEPPPADQSGGSAPPGRIDLHGLSVEEALARVIAEIDRSLLRGADRVEVVHGKGSGRIRDALHRRLAGLPVVAAFRLDPANAGATWIYFR